MSRFYTKFALSALLVLGLASATRAQEAKEEIVRPITKQGSAAMMFTFQGFGSFGIASPVIGMPNGVPVFGAGIKYFISDDMALRIGLGLATQSADTTEQGPSNGFLGYKYTNYGLSVGVEMHRSPLWSVSPYWGAQINYSGSTYDNNRTGVFLSKQQRNIFGVGVFAGFDWFFTHALALGAEIPFGFSSSGGQNTQGTAAATDVPTTTSIGFQGASAHFIAYF